MQTTNIKCRCGFEGVAADFWRGRICKPCKRAADSAAHAAQRDRARGIVEALTYGVEIESVGLSIRAAADAVAAAIAAESVTEGRDKYGRRCWDVNLSDGRRWRSVLDGSLTNCRTDGSAELVSPIMRSAVASDMEQVQSVARALRAAGAKADHSCGIHVHVGVAPLGGASGAAKLACFAAAVEPAIIAGLGVTYLRRGWCRPLLAETVGAYRRIRAGATTSTLSAALPSERYYGINLHAYEAHGTCEFRWFNGTLHAGAIRAAITLCVAFATKCASTSSVNAPAAEPTREGTLAVLDWLKVRDKTVREHLTAGFGPAREARAA